MSQKAPRPGQATFAAWLIIGGSVILVITAWERISSLHTIEVQEELQRVLSDPPFAGTGIGLNGLKTTIRILCMVAAAAATASTILGVQALRRSTGARLALTLLAPLVLIGGFATAGVFAPMVVAGVVMLWLRPTRDWFAGRPWVTAKSLPPLPDLPLSPRPPADQAKPPPPLAQPSRPGPYAGTYGDPLSAYGTPSEPDGVRAKRPGALIAACVIVWVSCALVCGFMVLLSLVMAVARDAFFDELERQQPGFDMKGMTQAELATGTYVATAVILIWSAGAIVLAALAMRQLHWARGGLVVSTGIAALVLLGMTFLSPPVVVLLVAALVTLWLLLRADVTAWFTRGGRRRRGDAAPRR